MNFSLAYVKVPIAIRSYCSGQNARLLHTLTFNVKCFCQEEKHQLNFEPVTHLSAIATGASEVAQLDELLLGVREGLQTNAHHNTLDATLSVLHS